MDFERKVDRRFVERVLASVGMTVESNDDHWPVERFSRALVKASSRRFPELTQGEALRRVGYEMVTKFKPTTSAVRDLGEAVTTLSGKLQAIGAFFDPQVTPRSEHHYVAHFDDVGSLPTFVLGLFEGVTSSSRPDVQVNWRPEGLSGARYEVQVRAAA